MSKDMSDKHRLSQVQSIDFMGYHQNSLLGATLALKYAANNPHVTSYTKDAEGYKGRA